MKRLAFSAVPILLLFIILSLPLLIPDPIEDLRLKVFDAFERLKPRSYVDVPVRIVDLDDASLKKLGQWPWPRTQLAGLIDRLTSLGARAIALDIIFSEQDRTSAQHILPHWPQTPEVSEFASKIRNLPDHDEIFAKSLFHAPAVIASSLTAEPNENRPLLKATFAAMGSDAKQYLPRFRGAIVSLDPIQQAAQGNGIINYLADSDGMIRRVPAVFRLHDDLYPSLAMEALRVAQGASTYLVKSSGASGENDFGENTGMTAVKIGSHVVPTEPAGRIWLYDTGFVPDRMIPAWQILESDFDRKRVEGKIIFVGTTAAGLKDIRATPLNPLAAGVEVHAQLVEQILLENFLIRPDWIIGAEYIFLIVLGLILAVTLPFIGAAWCALVAAISILGAFGFSWYTFSNLHLLMDPVLPSISVLIIYLAASLTRYLHTEAEKKQIRNAFSLYLSPALVKQLAERPENLKLGGLTREMSFLFADIRDFTALSEKLSPEELTHFMNRFLTPMTQIILEQNGTIDKYMGDAIMAFWNAPLEDTEHAHHACRAALAMQERLKTLNEMWSKEARSCGKLFSSIRVGIGLNTGAACVGNLGSDQRFNYSVLGDEVNLASRLEGLSKIYGIDMIVGQNTQTKARDFACLEMDVIQVKGKSVPVHIYSLLGDLELRASSCFQDLQQCHGEMLEAYRCRNWDLAEAKVNRCMEFLIREIRLAALNLEGFYKLYLERIKIYRHFPPEENWNGVFIAREK